jgi:hypothetical protein
MGKLLSLKSIDFFLIYQKYGKRGAQLIVINDYAIIFTYIEVVS